MMIIGVSLEVFGFETAGASEEVVGLHPGWRRPGGGYYVDIRHRYCFHCFDHWYLVSKE
jgi:hypothetical protein